jgi:hypothetical protein
LRAFDFDANPNVDPAVIHTLATCEWVKKGLPLRLIGDSGTGKSLDSRFARSYADLMAAPADRPERRRRDGRLQLGYMELDRRGAELLFPVLTEREEKISVAIASNESFSGWTKTFTGPALRGHRRPPHLRRRPDPDRTDCYRLAIPQAWAAAQDAGG